MNFLKSGVRIWRPKRITHGDDGQGISRYVRVLGRGQPAALLAVLRRENLEAAAQLEARLKHVQVVVVVFDVEHFGHVADSVLFDGRTLPSRGL
jgi:hypothetical protein